MGDPGSMMAISMGVSAASTLSSSYVKSKALKTQAKYEMQQAEANSRIALIKEQDAIEQGDRAAHSVRRKANQITGQQRTASAASGLDVNSGVSLDLQTETGIMSDLDMMTVKNNAWREAWGYRVQASDAMGAAKLSASGLRSEAKSTMLTGGLTSLSYATQGAYYAGRDNKLDNLFKDSKTTTLDASRGPTKGTMVAKNEPRRSKENPLFPDKTLNTSWWRNA